MRLASVVPAAVMIIGCGITAAQDDPKLAEALAAHDNHKYELAFELLLPLAEAGNSTAQSKIAHMYYWGEGRPKDDKEHFEWSLRSAQAGNPIGQFDVATDYYAGRGVAKDEKTGFKWTFAAAAGGDNYAQLALAIRHLNGFGARLDLELGKRYLAKAVDQDEPRALVLLATAHIFGEFGFPVNLDTGIGFLKRAAEFHHAGAQMSYGLHLLGTAQSEADLAEGLKWLNLSAIAGCEKAITVLASLQAGVSRQVFDRGTSMAGLWLATQPARAPHDHRDYKAEFCSTAPVIDALVTPRRDDGSETVLLAHKQNSSLPL